MEKVRTLKAIQLYWGELFWDVLIKMWLFVSLDRYIKSITIATISYMHAAIIKEMRNSKVPCFMQAQSSCRNRTLDEDCENDGKLKLFDLLHSSTFEHFLSTIKACPCIRQSDSHNSNNRNGSIPWVPAVGKRRESGVDVSGGAQRLPPAEQQRGRGRGEVVPSGFQQG